MADEQSVEAFKEGLDIRCCNRLSCFCQENAVELQRAIAKELRRIIVSGNAGDELVEFLHRLEAKDYQ